MNTKCIIVDMLDYVGIQPNGLRSLSHVYPEIWKHPPWNEYRKCPICGRYSGIEDVEKFGITTCSVNHSEVVLIEPWIADEVYEEIIIEMLKPGFIGFLLIDQYGSIVGFTWGELRLLDEVEEKTAHHFDLNAETVFYYSELGILNKAEYRGQGYGKMLVSKLVEVVQKTHFDMPSILRTNNLSPAYHLFTRAGYRLIPHEDVNPNRVIMMAEDTSLLRTIS